MPRPEKQSIACIVYRCRTAMGAELPITYFSREGPMSQSSEDGVIARGVIYGMNTE